MNFGPINQAGGGKRLNVAFSRSRVTMTIFSSIYSTDIKVTENSPDGLVAFRDFLKFAEGHDLNSETEESAASRYAKAGILNSIIRTIKENGFQCVPMVGHSDFHIDIAVVDPYEPTKYLMGILLDGEGYRQTTNTRDREVAQIGVLKNLGWALHRIWTIDWWDNREKELKKLVAMLEKLKAESQKKHETESVSEEDKAATEAKREAEAKVLKAELEKQAAEVIADDQEAAKEEKEVHVVADSPNVTTAKTDSTADSNTAQTATPAVDTGSLKSLLDQLKAVNAEVIDKRENGGALWIIGGKDLNPIIREFQKLGVHFIFKAGGGKATGGRDGWWARTDIVLPTDSANTEVVEEKKESVPAEAVPVNTTSSQQPVAELKEEPVEAKSEEAAQAQPAVGEEATGAGSAEQPVITPVPYTYAELPEDKMSPAEYAAASNKAEIGSRALAIVQAEAPILRDVLIRKVMASFGVNKSATVLDATEKALKAVKIKSTKQKGIVFCWSPDQDPKAYYGLRVSNDRSGDEICPQELCNAVVYALQTKDELGKDDLVKEASIVLGYKRLGKNLEAALTAGVQYARASGAIVYVPGGTFKLP